MNWLTYLAAVSAALPYLRPRIHPLSFLLWFPKMIAGALSPLYALIGAIGMLVGLFRKDWKLLGAGLLAFGGAGNFIRVVTSQPDGFAEVFGSAWQQQIPPAIRPFLQTKRWSPRLAIPKDVIWQPDIVYARDPVTGAPLLADIWQPRPDATRTGLAVVYVHGGAWRFGDKGMGTDTFFRRLAGQGHVVMDIAYTLGPDITIPQMVGDVKRAVLWLKTNAAAYGLNPERIVLMGGSAGGHLALLAAYTPTMPELHPVDQEEDCAVRAVVAFYAPTDFHTLYEIALDSYEDLARPGQQTWLGKTTRSGFQFLGLVPDRHEPPERIDFFVELLGGTPDQVPETYRFLSPINHVGTNSPPTLLIQGHDDVFHLVSGMRQLHESLIRAGAHSILVEYPHTEHGFDIVLPQISPVAQAAMYEVERFLALMV